LAAVPDGSDTHRSPRPRRRERWLAVVALVLAGALPAFLYRDLLGKVVSEFSFDANYFIFGASGFALMALGLAASIPVVFSIGRNPDSRLYPRSRGALAGWGVSLYLLGILLVVQISAVAADW
jgi:hypothetical protein